MRVPFLWMVLLCAAPRALPSEVPGHAARADESWIDVPFDSPAWARAGVDAAPVEHLGRSCLLLRNGLLWLPDADFLDGEIAFDIACSGRRTFVGAAWRIQDRANLEHFYLRPHQSGKPDSCQYTPVNHGSSAWQLFPGSAATIEYEPDRWMSVRLVVWEDLLQVYIDSDEPRLVTRTRREALAGGIGIQVPGFDPAHFSRFRYRALDQPPAGARPALEESAPGAVMTWTVSNAFAEPLLAERHILPLELLPELSWSAVQAEPSGVTNLARLQGTQPGADTCLARLILHASADAPVSIDFGFSDRVKVYHDRQLVYEGDDSYRSRDHRFLGTIGLYDRLTLQLREGPNEVLFAVSETFGGWGLMAAVQPSPGVRFD